MNVTDARFVLDVLRRLSGAFSGERAKPAYGRCCWCLSERDEAHKPGCRIEKAMGLMAPHSRLIGRDDRSTTVGHAPRRTEGG